MIFRKTVYNATAHPYCCREYYCQSPLPRYTKPCMLPSHLQHFLDQATQSAPPAQLARACEVLSGQYRAEQQGWHVSHDLAARAYLATRFPATFAALWSSLSAVSDQLPDWQPYSVLDVGAGPGTATCAALETWDTLQQATLLEGSAPMREWGNKLLPAAYPDLQTYWQAINLIQPLESETEPHDLVLLSYVLNEIKGYGERLIEQLWERTQGVLVIVEPGTPAGWQRIEAARAQLLALGGVVVTPCTHQLACPIQPPDWCHFSRRLERSKQHRQAKGGTLGYEDEKFSYVAVARSSVWDNTYNETQVTDQARVLAMPQGRSGLVTHKLCKDGNIERRVFSKRDGELFKRAKDAEWGDLIILEKAQECDKK